MSNNQRVVIGGRPAGGISSPRGGSLNISRMFDPGPNPIVELDQGENLEEEKAAEMSAVVKSIREGRAAYADFIKRLDDTKFFCCLVFQSEEQKVDFLAKANWLDTEPDTHNWDNMYLNGLEVARRMGIEIIPEVLPNLGRKTRTSISVERR